MIIIYSDMLVYNDDLSYQIHALYAIWYSSIQLRFMIENTMLAMYLDWENVVDFVEIED